MSSAFEQLCHQQVINRWRVMNDAVLASTLAAEAGELLLALRGSGDRSPEELRAQGDALSQDLLARRLGEERPDDAVLSEEAKDSPARLSASRVWIIDPLDGTREYGEGRADWAVHVALWVDGELAAGAVAIPAEGLVLDTAAPLRRPDAADRIRLAVSRTRPPAFVTALAESLDAQLVPMGSAGVKATAVLRGQVDAYVHAGGQYEWDSAAPVAVARAAGLHTSRIDGSPLLYNQPDPLLPDLVVALPEVAERVLAAVSALEFEEVPAL
jgi:3'(2'), 5'-bisphosphate nucleotidase